MREFPKSATRDALRNCVIRTLQRGVQLFHTYRSLSVRSDVHRSRPRKRGANGIPPNGHLVQQSRLTAPVPQGVSVVDALWPAPHPGAKERQDSRNLAARRDLMAFVYGRPS